MRNPIRIASVLSVVLAAAVCVPQAEARRYKQMYNGREVVVHSSALPVVLHRLVPPQHGRHVTEREIQTGRVPAPGPIVLQQPILK